MPPPSPDGLTTLGGVLSAGIILASAVWKILDRVLPDQASARADLELKKMRDQWQRIHDMLESVIVALRRHETQFEVDEERHRQHFEITKEIRDRIDRLL